MHTGVCAAEETKGGAPVDVVQQHLLKPAHAGST